MPRTSPTVGFDLDLTLVDSRVGIRDSWAQLARDTGVDIDADACANRTGPPLEHEMAQWFPAAEVAARVLEYRAIYGRIGVRGAHLLPGAAAAVAAVHAAGGRVVVVTAKKTAFAVRMLDHLGLPVDAVHGLLWDEGKARGLRAEGAGVYVGDHPADVRGARAAGALAVGVQTGPEDPVGADVVLVDLTSFPAWFSGWREGLTTFETHVRREPPAGPGDTVERDGPVVRIVHRDGGWNGVVWSDLGDADPTAVIARQVARYAELGLDWEWKHYSHDEPADLPDRLAAAGLVAEPPEAVLLADLGSLALDDAVSQGIRLVRVTGAAGVAAMVDLHDRVFGGDHVGIGATLAAALGADPPPVVAVLAMAGDQAVAAGRIELMPGSPIAGLWGGGTLPEWRGRGIFRALVAYRAAIARKHGCRWLTVDARPDSEPILRRLGFVRLATTTPWISTPWISTPWVSRPGPDTQEPRTAEAGGAPADGL